MIKIWGWEKKPQAMLRYIKIGDIFCFRFDANTCCFGRIMADVTFHIAEIFDFISEQPVISEDDIRGAGRLTVIPLDTYSLFDRRSEGEWRIIGHQENCVPENAEWIYFSRGTGSGCRRSGVFGNTFSISEDEWQSLPSLSSNGDYDVKREVADKPGRK